ncbi:hypothetical protein [Stappia sp. WLB 29]|uniref:hypothetical protein n=1 Tax=Stappia sp. WLB 29 TaxID=2925220 RepID=UPI0020BECDE5|nr:hypothetical protein [Stappia sp. WLB 29]
MSLRDALGGVEDVDPTRPLSIGALTLGVEAAAEAANLLSGVVAPPFASIVVREVRRPFYWIVDHAVQGQAEMFGFPTGWAEALPTAIEIALVRALAALPIDQHPEVLAGGAEIVLGPEDACADFRTIASAAESPMVGESTELAQFSSAVIAPTEGVAVKVALNCLLSSYATSPLKFRFLELYRVMEALFIADVRSRLFATFDAQPSASLAEATEALKSELRQITALAEPHQDLFEECWNRLHALRNANRFAAALFRRIEEKKANGQGKWRTGAALVYQVRCAIVHAGERDMIFENFADGDAAIKTIIPPIERAALRMLGITLG